MNDFSELQRTIKIIILLADHLDSLFDAVTETQDEFDAAVQVHLSALLEKSESTITEEVLTAINQLYDYPVVTHVAQALDVSVQDLQRMLGRKATKPCIRCGVSIELFEWRVKGGYSKNPGWLYCEACRAKIDEERYAKLVAETEKWKKVEEIEEKMDRLLISMPMKGAIHLPALKEHLLGYGHYWADKSARRHINDPEIAAPFTISFGHGCMICGAAEVQIFLTHEENFAEPQNDSCLHHLCGYWELQETQLYAPELPGPHPKFQPFKKVLQLLWRLQPGEYYLASMIFPLNQLPLLVVCSEHSTAFVETHFPPYPDTFHCSENGDKSIDLCTN